MNKRQKSALETKKRLIKSALELLREKGFEAINVEEITKKADVAKGTFYIYFKRKEDIVLEICRTPFKEIAEALQLMDDKNLVEKLAYYFHRFMECVEIYGINTCREWIKDVIDPNNVLDSQDGQKWQYDFQMLNEILESAVQNNELKTETPVKLLTHLIICQLYGMMICWCMSDGKFEPLDWADKFSSIQLQTILAPYLTKDMEK